MNPLADDDTARAAVNAAARGLHLPTMREVAGKRAERRRVRRVGEGHFPRIKRLADFNLDAAPTLTATQFATLASGTYRDAGEPGVLLGDSGTG